MAKHTFVGAVDVTGQITSPTVDAAFYNLGAFDTVADNGDGTVTITRQTGYADTFQELSKKLGIDIYGDGVPPWASGRLSINTAIFEQGNIVSIYPVMDGDSAWNYSGSANFVISYSGSRISIYSREDIGGPRIRYTKIELQWKLPTSYTETVIKGRPLSQLSAGGEEWVEREYKKTVNLMPQSEITVVANNATYVNEATQAVFVEIGKTYTVSFVAQVTNASMCPYVAVYYNGTHSNKTGEFNTNKQTLSFTFTATDQKFYLLIYATTGTKLTNTTTLSNIMLVESPVPVPYVPYDASGHIENSEAQLLLDEYQKTINLFNTAAYRGNYTGNNASTIWQNDGTAILRATSSSDPYAWGTDVIMLPAGTYTLSFKRSIAGSATYIYIPKSGQGHYTSLGTAAGLIGAPFTVDGNTQMRIRFGGDNSGSNQDTVYSDFMLTKEDAYVPYVPYHGPIVHEGDAGVLLWKNSSPNAAFAAQTISVADMSKYKYVDIVYKMWMTDNICLHQKYDVQSGVSTTMFYSTTAGTHARDMSFDSATSITFGATDLNGTLVPVAIYGTNIL